MPQNFLSLLVCPVTKQHLLPLGARESELLRQAINEGELYYVDGKTVTVPPDMIEFLITENRHHLYSVINEVPVLLGSRQIQPLEN